MYVILFLFVCLFVLQTKMVQHIRKKHPEFAQMANSIQAPMATAVISSTPAVITTDSTTAEAVVVRHANTHRFNCVILSLMVMMKTALIM